MTTTWYDDERKRNDMVLQKYFLTSDATAIGKKLGHALNKEGWQKSIATVLLSNSPEEKKVQEISTVLSDVPSSSRSGDLSPEDRQQQELQLKLSQEQELIHGYLEMLPRSYKNKAKLLTIHLLRHIASLDEDGVLIYRNTGERGSYLIDVLRYFCSPESS